MFLARTSKPTEPAAPVSRCVRHRPRLRARPEPSRTCAAGSTPTRPRIRSKSWFRFKGLLEVCDEWEGDAASAVVSSARATRPHSNATMSTPGAPMPNGSPGSPDLGEQRKTSARASPLPTATRAADRPSLADPSGSSTLAVCHCPDWLTGLRDEACSSCSRNVVQLASLASPALCAWPIITTEVVGFGTFWGGSTTSTGGTGCDESAGGRRGRWVRWILAHALPGAVG